MRASFTPKEGETELPPVHSGDDVSLLVQAHLPQIYKEPGAFDRREYLAKQNIDLMATLRSTKLLEIISTARPTLTNRLDLFRSRLRQQLHKLFADSPQSEATLRAMPLGDRSFVDRVESVEFQKTGVFHVFVIAGLHVGALIFFLNWLFRKLRFPRSLATILLLILLFTYITVVEQSVSVLRAGLMVAIVVIGSTFYRRLDLLNSAGLAALILLIANPRFLLESGFQLSFFAIACIAGVAVPWLDAHVQPYLRALAGWLDRTCDISFAPVVVQFRLDVRSPSLWLTSRLAGKIQLHAQNPFIGLFRCVFHITESFALSFVLHLGMLPLMTRDFHRIPLLGPVANLLSFL